METVHGKQELFLNHEKTYPSSFLLLNGVFLQIIEVFQEKFEPFIEIIGLYINLNEQKPF